MVVAHGISFMSGLVNSHVQTLVTVESLLYALTPTEMLKSTDGGELWETIGLNTNRDASLEGIKAKVATANGVLYVSNSELTEVTLFRLSDAGDVFLPVEGVPNFEEDTLHIEWQKKLREARENNVDVDKVRELRRSNDPRIAEEWRTNGTFTVADDTVFMEYKHKLFRWRRGETAWLYTGLEDTGFLTLPDESSKGLTLAVSGNVVYAGKRQGELFQSLGQWGHLERHHRKPPLSVCIFQRDRICGFNRLCFNQYGSHAFNGWRNLARAHRY